MCIYIYCFVVLVVIFFFFTQWKKNLACTWTRSFKCKNNSKQNKKANASVTIKAKAAKVKKMQHSVLLFKYYTGLFPQAVMQLSKLPTGGFTCTAFCRRGLQQAIGKINQQQTQMCTCIKNPDMKIFGLYHLSW